MNPKFVLLSLLPLVVSPVSGAVITPFSANASSVKVGSSVTHLIDGSGLFTDATRTVADNSITGVHSEPWNSGNTTSSSSWVWQDGATTVDNPIISGEWVEFDMGALTELTGTYVWQATFGSTGRQLRTFDITYSTDDVTYNTISLNAQLAQVATPANGSTAEFFTFGATPIEARYIRFEINGTYENTAGNQNWLGGIGEVKFEGTAIPEPSAALLGGLGLLALLRRRRA